MEDEAYLNEVVDEVVKEPVSNVEKENDISQTKKKNISENEEQREVSNEKNLQFDDSDNGTLKDHENRIDNNSVSNISSDYRTSNETENSIDIQVLESNTIQPEKELKSKKPVINMEEENIHNGDEISFGSEALKEEHDNTRTAIADLLPDYHDDENNLIVEDKKSFIVKSQPLSKPKEKPVIISTSTSHPVITSENDRSLSTDNNTTNTSVLKNTATATTELLNEVENESLSRSDLDEQHIISMNKNAKDLQKIVVIKNNQSNSQSSKRRKLGLEINKQEKDANYDDDKMNELGKEPIPVLLNQRAKRSAKKDIIKNVILFIKQFL